MFLGQCGMAQPLENYLNWDPWSKREEEANTSTTNWAVTKGEVQKKKNKNTPNHQQKSPQKPTNHIS